MWHWFPTLFFQFNNPLSKHVVFCFEATNGIYEFGTIILCHLGLATILPVVTGVLDCLKILYLLVACGTFPFLGIEYFNFITINITSIVEVQVAQSYVMLEFLRL